MKIAYNTFISYKRSKKVSLEDIETATARSLLSNDDSDSAFRYQTLYLALKKLSEKERTALLLHYMEGYQIKEIASILGTTTINTKQILSRGRQHLRNFINPTKIN